MTTDLRQDRHPRVFYGWYVVIIVGLAGVVQSAQGHPALGVFMKPMTEEFGWTRGIFTYGMTIGSFLGGFLAIAMGPLVDRYGARVLLTGGSFIVGGTLLLTSMVTTFWQFFALQVLARMVNMGVVALSMQVIIPKWFVKKRGRAVAFGGIGNLAGNAFTPLYIQYFVSNIGWRGAAAIAGLVVWTVSLVPTALFLRRSPEDIGLTPDGNRPEADLGVGNRIEPGMTAGVEIESSLTLREVLSHSSFYLLLVAFTLAIAVGSSVNLHSIPYFSDRGLEPELAVIVMALFACSAAAGALILGFLVERYQVRVVLAVNFLFVAAGFILLLSVQSSIIALAWGAYAGFVGGGGFTLQQVIFADYYGRDSLGAIRGVMSPFHMSANAFGPLAASIAFDMTGNYLFIFGLYGVFTLFSCGCVYMAKPPIHPSSTRMPG